FFIRSPLTPSSTLFPYTTLFRSEFCLSLVKQFKGWMRGNQASCVTVFFTNDQTTLRYLASLRKRLIPRLPLIRVRRDNVRWFGRDRKSTRLNSSHLVISYAVFCL